MALKGDVKTKSTKDFLEIDIELCRQWIEIQKGPKMD